MENFVITYFARKCRVWFQEISHINFSNEMEKKPKYDTYFSMEFGILFLYFFHWKSNLNSWNSKHTYITHASSSQYYKKGILGGRVKKKEKKKSIGGRLISYFVKPSFLLRISSTDISFCSISSFLWTSTVVVVVGIST